MTLLGEPYTDQFVEEWTKQGLNGNDLAKDERGLVGFKLDTKNEELRDKIFTSEEILSMILEHA